ncbi:MAG: iron ABC transporter permease [Phycisphaeraceae bacterium]|nr:MAG: iron ABC transporter permease [Phycisphaeraceae bacterium]
MPRSWRVGLAIASVIVLALVVSPLAYIGFAIFRDPGAAWSAAARADVWMLTARSITLAACVTVSALALATLLAWLIARTDTPGGRHWLIPLALPLAAPSFLVAEAYRGALGVDGFLGAWLAMTLITYPYALLPLVAALRRINQDLELAARSLGLGPWRGFWSATLPQILPTLEWTGLLIGLYALSDYGCVAILEVKVLTFAIESRRAAFDPAGAAALSGVLSLLALLCLLGIGRLRGSRGAGTADAQTEPISIRIPLRVWKLPASLLCAGTVAIAVGLPFAMALSWWTTGLEHSSETIRSTILPALTPAARTLQVSLITAVIAAIAALPITLIIHRGEYVRGRSWMERFGALALIGYGLPGVVIGFALVRIGLETQGLFGLYQTLPLLLAAYAIKCVAEALGPATAAARRLHTDRLDAAIGLGASFTRTWVRVGWPAIAPGVAAGAALAFLTVVKELPITLILRPTGFDTLAFELFDLLNEARHMAAAPMALMMLIVSSAVVWVLVGAFKE